MTTVAAAVLAIYLIGVCFTWAWLLATDDNETAIVFIVITVLSILWPLLATAILYGRALTRR